MKLTRVFALITAALVVLVGLMLFQIALFEWRNLRSSEAGLEAMRVAYQAMVVAEKASFERGPTNGVLGDGEPPDAAKRERLQKARATTDQAIAQLDAALARSKVLREGEAASVMRVATAQLKAARQQVDEVAAIPKAERTPERLMATVRQMFDVIPVVMEAVTLLSRDARALYPEFADAIVGARLAAELREHAGRLGSQFTAALNSGQPLAEPEQRAIEQLRGRIDQLRVLIELPARSAQADPRIQEALAQMKQRYFGSGLAFVAEVEQASREARPFGMDTAQFAARYVPDMGSIVQLRDVMINLAIEGGQARQRQARRNLLATAAIGLATLAVLAGVSWVIRRRVLRPLLDGTAALSDIARGKLDGEVPTADRADEIGDLLRAVAQLKASSIEKQRLEAELRASHDQIAQQASQLERRNETLKENVRLREEVERISRHDIKTPLNSIIAIPRLLRDDPSLGSDARELLGIVERAGYRILSMVNLSLDLYKMENGSYIFRPDVVDLGELVGKVRTDLNSHAQSRGVRLVTVVPDQPVRAWAEELLCYSMLANLLKNAVEASHEGGEVRVSLRRDEERVEIHIHNQGAVPESIRPNFFQKYTTAGKASGTGLGAYSAWRMARVQDGDIAMRTDPHEGTTISVMLRAAPPGQLAPADRHAQAHRAEATPEPGSLPALKVLLVDDDEYNLLIVRRLLPSPPLAITTADNGRVALERAEADWPDLVIMDLDMPVMNGLEAVQRLRELESAQGLPRCRIVALSSHEDAQTQERALAAGFDRYLTKPVTREALHDTLTELHTGWGELPTPDPDLAPLLPSFLVSRRKLLAQLAAAAEQGEQAELQRLAHLLAGSFAMHGFGWASERCRWLEAQPAGPGTQEVRELVGQLQRHLDSAERQLLVPPAEPAITIP